MNYIVRLPHTATEKNGFGGVVLTYKMKKLGVLIPSLDD
jgi:hypothetical protein